MLSVQLQHDIKKTVTWALCEDLGVDNADALKNSQDITAELIPLENIAVANIITREDCIICGVAYWRTVCFKFFTIPFRNRNINQSLC